MPGRVDPAYIAAGAAVINWNRPIGAGLEHS
jgi:hypothetical protein